MRISSKLMACVLQREQLMPFAVKQHERIAVKQHERMFVLIVPFMDGAGVFAAMDEPGTNANIDSDFYCVAGLEKMFASLIFVRQHSGSLWLTMLRNTEFIICARSDTR